jgi:hypothetical protein
MKTVFIVLGIWTMVSLIFCFVIWPRIANRFIPATNDTFIRSRCRKCGNIQRCCAPPCSKCQSIDMEMLK